MRQSPSSYKREKLKEGQNEMERDKGEKQSCVWCKLVRLSTVMFCADD